MTEYNLKTPAKINLFLQVKNKNSNDYHEIETVFLPLKNIYDTIKITFTTSSKITIVSDSIDIPADKTNLCFKAAEAYFKYAQINPGVNIFIKKRIPIAAGMGGGSSDAAAVLLILHKKFNLLNRKKLLELASKLGADVSFFLNTVASIGRGIGEILTPIDINDNFNIIICAPHFPVSAAWAYKNLNRENNNINLSNCLNSLTSNNIEKIADCLRNDLAFALYKKFPVLKILKTALIESGALNTEITGSGPTLFGICKTGEQAESIIKKMKNRFNSDIEYKVSAILNRPFTVSIT
ncbi:MAG TPA: 4-(cytidine 5'-diphospho)-2-C-methyl-D-erythritol kinase [Victivallales bacterium]|nr:4-(cytidine 5'-diphospho)-2-C-methyl-D-erythritol kinase [Victivallales bacterium]